ncbi:DUF7573 domain-containing protein [Natrinema limicola]|uniref:DUF7573 domain-containing protein n=1 Tax=Natrinema limicola JCM 13563 TaxID=1230457 RepID=M0CKR1_9EURY|nr:hypothetical protein [Natrinema limicola]ELZ23218.1 hypothetical protein C476_05083 [Natrinema limicola JCM 13563]
MTDDATLSDFATADDESSADASTDTAGSTGGASRSTYAWGEYICTQCKQSTDRVWRDDGDLVCPDCKSW